ncbi:MAG: ATP-dependent Clp protease adaptor ClpS [Deltaproteobacteria bacterium]|nr:ATP-dependent Clp protease adaptor ClpS [Deltaproteobacteria bacterium]
MSNKAPKGETDVVTKTKQETKTPRQFKVLLHNDDYTTMEFVVWLLMNVFHHDQTSAHDIMLKVHRGGVGVAGTYSREIAETKVAKTIQLARQHDFPLEASMEPE